MQHITIIYTNMSFNLFPNDILQIHYFEQLFKNMQNYLLSAEYSFKFKLYFEYIYFNRII